MDVLTQNFFQSASTVVQILVVSLVGFLLAKKRMLTQYGAAKLTQLVFWIFLPSLIIATITTSFDPSETSFWWMFPLGALFVYAIGLICGRLSFGGREDTPFKGEYILSCMFQNCGILPLSLLLFACGGDACGKIFVYIFLFNLVTDFCMWTIPFVILKHGAGHACTLGNIPLLNPPAIATSISVLTVLIFKKGFLPELVTLPLGIVGKATFPVALLVLGASLFYHKGYQLDSIRYVIRALIVKLGIIPLCVLLLLLTMPLVSDLKFVIFLQAIMPTAVTLVLVGDVAKANNAFISGVIFYSHIFSIFTIPIWLFIYGTINV